MPEFLHFTRRLSLFLFVPLLYACGLPADLDGFDDQVWKNDQNGCGGNRIPMKEVFISQKEKIKGLDEPQILRLLGKPDKQELYIRSQKFFVYYIEPGEPCQTDDTTPLTLTVRFNALGYTNEVFLENLTE